MRIGMFLISSILALCVASGFFALDNNALAASRGENKKKCVTELKNIEKKWSQAQANQSFSSMAERSMDRQISMADGARQQGKYGRCRRIIKKLRGRMERLIEN